ncbi:MAG TPA: alpha/beta fold hydrolase [Polyangia bacterium]|jgi:alpha/beta superfamily hydrolase|nr:alpha/beta fold hydrolase [Polyangia bacterium]
MSTNPTLPSISPSGRLSIAVAHGQLEAILKEPAAPVAAAVVCHPHPLGGGTMNNNVVYRVGRALGDAGVAVLRFNFRGVGASTGHHDGGAGEEEDARAALDLLALRHPDLPLWMAGFSFGARVGLTVGAREPRVTKLFGIGLALSMFDYTFLNGCAKPKAIIQAANDEYGGRAAVEPAVAKMIEPKRLWVVDGASHLFPQHLAELEAAAALASTWLLDQ